jgi:hypothetical protein
MNFIRITDQKSTLLTRKVGFFLSIAMLIVVLIPIPASAQAPNCDNEFYSSNDIVFYNPCSADTCSSVNTGGALTSAGPTSLTGETNQEKVWNYFITRGLTPVASAGAMGNIQQESEFSAAVEEHSGGGGLGLIQWTGSRRTSLESAAAAAGVNLADNDSALLFELNYLWDGEYGGLTWQEQVNAEESIDGDTSIASYNDEYSSTLKETQTGNGSTMVFHALVERSGDTPTMLKKRIENATAFLTQFNGTAAKGSCGNARVGGLTWDQAVSVAKKMGDTWDTVYCGDGSIKAGFYCSLDIVYSTAGAAWMIETTAPNPSAVPKIPSGVDVANRLISSNPDIYVSANPDGSNLQPFSIWSFGNGSASGAPGHTGTIVGVNEDGSIITLETNWDVATPGSSNSFLYNSGHKIAVYQYPSFDVFKSSRKGYVYNDTATPKDSSIATEMAKKMQTFVGK